MFRDDEAAARHRRDEVAREVDEAQARHDALARRLEAARRAPRLMAAMLGSTAVAIVAGAWIAGSRAPAVPEDFTVVTIDAGVAAPLPPLAADAPTSAVEERCRLAEAEPCARLAKRAESPAAAYPLWRRACIAGHRKACLAVADALLDAQVVAHDPETAVTLGMEGCMIDRDEESCAWLRRRCDEGHEKACRLGR